ncbi:uncharacterized protein ASCRUDRAFT_121495 [Ascoidea rubescens DSM 1968]|uniref:Secreted protein n=1 Tax=Ascoidea rubescens DSM 1968 TaxID=1344418 RepID=A0A1D2VA03_9ASCO|nr:hypothetical protein ASCRUDRAFT_121495 [Ascoidea rubescens DSM 1968]ODV58464.1 hypothetical protein ASCRUDRAFT_121495 [Ascoidea rubescens DSM 1968]
MHRQRCSALVAGRCVLHRLCRLLLPAADSDQGPVHPPTWAIRLLSSTPALRPNSLCCDQFVISNKK